jgi:hypothetical protein
VLGRKRPNARHGAAQLKAIRLGRVTIFAKGNLDVRDTLHSLRIGDKLLWNGINDIVRRRFPGTVVRLKHETWTRSDALLAANGTVPAEVAARSLPLGPFPAAAQFSQALFETQADAFVLSIQPDVHMPMVRHRRDGYLLHPHECDLWPEADRAWMRQAFLRESFLGPAAAMTHFAAIVARLRERSTAPILVYNLSPIDPGEWVHCYRGLGEIVSTRVRRFNLGLIELSRDVGISIVDVDTILARAGAARLKYDAGHLTSEGCRLVADEVVRILEDVGCLPPEVPQ